MLSAARDILGEHSLADLSMRRLATELGVSPNALYWYFPNKQSLLAALGDDILADVVVPSEDLPWDERLEALAHAMRASLCAVPDSAEVVSSSWSSGLSSMTMLTLMTDAARSGGLPEPAIRGLVTAIAQLVIGLTLEEQTRRQMDRLGVTGPVDRDFDAEFADALAIVLAGARNIDPAAALA
ncbi:putative TetR family transcriptional regulator [Gordonia araii NBRC 100433]|uniref:Putative TetR family transcriptional regulator n=1 Tax=Gordonia araii NBRC 100433 TaxID=1073574 RepID=G7H2R1_9ACTN|nr:putative TetR family transcriptional regulator [Gordonia araii NBRC 100433]